MAVGLLFDCDDQIASMLFAVYKQQAYKYDRCIGLMTPQGTIVGAVLFHHWNGTNIEMSYYGKQTMSVGLVRCIARFIVCTFSPARLTVMTSKRNKRFMRALQRLGFKLEGHQRCYYGFRDCGRNTGVRFVMFRDRIDSIAKLEAPKVEARQC